MKKQNIIWVTLVFLLVLCIYLIGISFSEDIKKYQILEEDIKEAADIYINQKKINIPVSENYRINIDKLEEENLIDKRVDNDVCNGYVIVKKQIKDYDIKSYIKCNKYQTDNYKES